MVFRYHQFKYIERYNFLRKYLTIFNMLECVLSFCLAGRAWCISCWIWIRLSTLPIATNRRHLLRNGSFLLDYGYCMNSLTNTWNVHHSMRSSIQLKIEKFFMKGNFTKWWIKPVAREICMYLYEWSKCKFKVITSSNFIIFACTTKMLIHVTLLVYHCRDSE